MTGTTDTILVEQLEQLFVARLRYISEEEPIVSSEGRESWSLARFRPGMVTGEVLTAHKVVGG